MKVFLLYLVLCLTLGIATRHKSQRYRTGIMLGLCILIAAVYYVFPGAA